MFLFHESIHVAQNRPHGVASLKASLGLGKGPEPDEGGPCGCGREGQGADAGRWGEECPTRLGKVDKSRDQVRARLGEISRKTK